MSCLLLEHVGCTPLGYYVGSPQPSQSQGDVGCGWDELLRADMRTCQTGLAAASLRTHRQMEEKVGETDERWFLFSPTTSGWTSALAVLFWLSSVSVCVRVCACSRVFVHVCLATEQAQPVVRQHQHGGKTRALPAGLMMGLGVRRLEMLPGNVMLLPGRHRTTGQGRIV